jgi:hypothetical protein
MAAHDPTCQRCGQALDPRSLDVRVTLPDPVLAMPVAERASRTWGGDPLLQVDEVGAFVRCLLPVHLTGGLLLTFGTWLAVHPDDLRRAHAVWETDGYVALELTGVLANAIKPWGDGTLGRARIAVRDADHLPYVVASPHAVLGRVIADEWDRDSVLMCLAHALPVSIQRRVNADWSVERGAGFTSGVHDGSLRFVAPGRTVIVDALNTPSADAVDDVLASLLDRAPTGEDQLTERAGDELRHAFWTVAVVDGRAQHELYGTVLRPGTAIQVTCVHDDPDDHEWAMQTWRSVRYHVQQP